MAAATELFGFSECFTAVLAANSFLEQTSRRHASRYGACHKVLLRRGVHLQGINAVSQLKRHRPRHRPRLCSALLQGVD